MDFYSEASSTPFTHGQSASIYCILKVISGTD